MPSHSNKLLMEALDRTLLLMEDDLEASRKVLLATLMRSRVHLVADRANLMTTAGQHALVCTALLVSRFGASVSFESPNVPLLGSQPPLKGLRILDALLNCCADLIPGVQPPMAERPSDADLVVVIGDSAWPGSSSRAIRLVGDEWAGSFTPAMHVGSRWRENSSGFGALAAAGLAAGEAYKIAMLRLTKFAKNTAYFEEVFAAVPQALIRLAPPHTPVPAMLGAFDCISGGAITQSALFALARIDGATARARVIEADTSELSNLNRNALLRRSRVGIPKAHDIKAQLENTNLEIDPILARYTPERASEIDPLRPNVLVGVDHIPSRWFVAEQKPIWVGIGATSHYSAMTSFHAASLPCVRCVHPVNDEGEGLIPTLSFVSHWAGLHLAALFVRHVGGDNLSGSEQVSYATLLRPDSPSAYWIGPGQFRSDCDCRSLSEPARS
jgi:hypothetical protein